MWLKDATLACRNVFSGHLVRVENVVRQNASKRLTLSLTLQGLTIITFKSGI